MATLVETAFAADRVKIRLLIDARMKELSAAGAASATAVEGPISARPEQVTSVTPAPRSETTGDKAISTLKSGESVPATSAGSEAKHGRWIVVLGVVAVAAIVGVLLARRTGGDATTAVTSATATAAPAEAMINVSIAADPAETRVFLDDVALATNPFHGAMLRSTLARRLRVSAPGFATEERLVTLDRDLNLEMALKPAPIGSATPTATTTVAAAARTPAAPLGAGTGAPRAVTPPATPAGPGDAVGGPVRKKPRTIDDTF